MEKCWQPEVPNRAFSASPISSTVFRPIPEGQTGANLGGHSSLVKRRIGGEIRHRWRRLGGRHHCSRPLPSCGLAQALDRPINIDWQQTKLDCFDRLSLKSYNSAVPTESPIFCILELHKMHPFNPADVVSIEAEMGRMLDVGPAVRLVRL
jgi:hypothetical protein